MVLKKYFLKRFFKYLFIINISLTFLFNFIEFFEKIVRVKHATIGMILHFITLNIPSSFFLNLNVSCWLTTCLLIKEFAEQNEWETFKILNINYYKLFKLFLFAGLITAAFTFVGKEKLTLSLHNKSEKFKFEKLKQTSYQKIYNKWLELKSSKEAVNIKNNSCFKKFSFFQFLDLKENKGYNLILININNDFEIENITSADTFKISPFEKHIFMKKAVQINTKENTQKIQRNEILYLPSFFSQLQLSNFIPPLSLIFKNIIFEKKFLPKNVWYDFISELLKRLFFYLQTMLYPVLTLCFFLLFEHHKKYKWASIFLPYPIIILSDLMVDFFANQNFLPIFLFLPYLLIILFIFFYKKKLAKNS